jgi:hypothetical protein
MNCCGGIRNQFIPSLAHSDQAGDHDGFVVAIQRRMLRRKAQLGLSDISSPRGRCSGAAQPRRGNSNTAHHGASSPSPPPLPSFPRGSPPPPRHHGRLLLPYPPRPRKEAPHDARGGHVPRSQGQGAHSEPRRLACAAAAGADEGGAQVLRPRRGHRPRGRRRARRRARHAAGALRGRRQAPRQVQPAREEEQEGVVQAQLRRVRGAADGWARRRRCGVRRRGRGDAAAVPREGAVLRQTGRERGRRWRHAQLADAQRVRRGDAQDTRACRSVDSVP